MKTNLKQHIEYSKDPVLFMKENWLGFDAFEKKCKNLTPFEYQIEFIRNIHNIDKNFAIKSRQMHISSMMTIYIAWYVIFNQNKQVVIMAHNLKGAKRILEQIKIILQNYSVDDEKNETVNQTYFHWEDDFVINKQTELKLKNGCRIQTYAPFANSGKGCPIDFLYIDEAAFIKKFEQIYMALAIAANMNKNSKTVIASTPYDNSFFNKLFLNATDDGYSNIIRLHWSLHPVYSKGIQEDRVRESPYQYTSPWFEDMVKNYYRNSVSAVEQELECVVRYQEETNKIKTISLRMDEAFYKKISNHLKPGETISNYIRSLIEKDLKYFL